MSALPTYERHPPETGISAATLAGLGGASLDVDQPEPERHFLSLDSQAWAGKRLSKNAPCDRRPVS